MAISFDISDTYVRRARLQPALLVVFPIALAVLAYFPGGIVGWGVLWSLLVACGGTALLAQVARDRGKQMEAELFRRWGGKPTTRLLRHRDTDNRALLARRHAKLTALLPDHPMPSFGEEAEEKDRADEVYDSCTALLLAKTRDRKAFPLIFEENCNYGFRRNLWGMKPLGILTSLCGGAAIVTGQLLRVIHLDPLGIICTSLCLLMLLAWIVWFTPDWVRLAADAFAQQLLAACDALEPAPAK
jgi:hypothetical protein